MKRCSRNSEIGWLREGPRSSRRGPAAWAALLLLLPLVAACATAGRAWAEDDLSDGSCLECHGDPELTGEVDGEEVSLFVSDSLFAASIHGAVELACIDCHVTIAEIPHEDALPLVDCGLCHADAVEALSEGVHKPSTSGGGADLPRCSDCHGTHGVLPSDDPASRTHAFQLPSTCAQCHADPSVVARHEGISAKSPLEAYLQSVHGRSLLLDRNPSAPSCSGCHGAHRILNKEDPESPLHKSRIPHTCGRCHEEISGVFQESVHGAAVARGNPDAPACNDCHGEHQIESPSRPTSLVYPANLDKTTCTRCHESLVLAQRYGFGADRPQSYRETYHGLAGKLGGLPVANCASCHGVHNIYPSNDERSTVHEANLQETCGSCHPSATVRFTQIPVHASADAPSHSASRVIRSVYIWLLVVVIGGMFLHNALIWFSHVVRKYRREKASVGYRRFSPFEQVEHVLLGLSFFTLVITGFALKYSDAAWVNWLAQWGFDERVRSVIHRVSGVVMIVLGVAHTAFFLGTARGRRDIRHLMPALRDVRELAGTVGYYLGSRREKPKPARYDYAEKAEYLALIWGTVVMILTGLALWFPDVVTRWSPGWLIEVSEVVHFYEAWLAFLAILVWHFFFVIFHPDEYPLNLTFLTGKITKHKVEERELPPEDLSTGD